MARLVEPFQPQHLFRATCQVGLEGPASKRRDRPYRAGLHYEEILPIMRALAPRKLDGDCVSALNALLGSERENPYEPLGIPMEELTRVCA